MVALQEYAINDKVYIDIKDIKSEYKGLFKGIRSYVKFLEKNNIKDFIYGQIINGEAIVSDCYSKKLGTILINKEELIDMIKIGEEKKKKKEQVPLAPPLIEDNDLVLFQDEEGNKYKVPTRGKRTKGGIFFEVNAIMKIFQMNSLNNDILQQKSRYQYSIDYMIFNDNHQHKLYLTFIGLQKVISSSRIINCTHKYGYIYLIQMQMDNEIIYKFGKTWNLQQRTNTHISSFSRMGATNITLIKFIKIDIPQLSKAEIKVKRYLESIGCYLNSKYSNELCKFGDNDSYNQLLSFYDSLEQKYFTNSSLTLNASKQFVSSICDIDDITFTFWLGTREQKKDLVSELLNEELFDSEDLQKQLEAKDREIEMLKSKLKDYELELKDREIEMLRMKLNSL